ncbi:Uncharacterised protein [Citrobacter koseri]|uniref:Uncharacterized protein n=1 Tax=Citrobacter koseri TaxID=545 RepID=A0A3S4M8Z8_CITKO|nr:Uncharacterised protein [Citrobacter koseri]
MGRSTKGIIKGREFPSKKAAVGISWISVKQSKKRAR